MRRHVRAVRSAVLERVRTGEPTVIWAPGEGLGFGNVLYLWLRAHRETAAGRPTVVLLPAAMEPWVTAFPALEALSVRAPDVPRRARRTWGWYSAFGSDFERADLHDFVRERLLTPAVLGRAEVRARTLTVNVRRGNYYSVPHFRGTYSFDIRAYLVQALAQLRPGPEVERLLVVSDGVEWCRLKLHDVLSTVGPEVEYCTPTDGPVENFLDCAASGTLVATNSTFSYWAGHVSNVVHGAGSRVVAPRFHARLGTDHDAYQLDPQWVVVEEIPGGWDA